jgi:dihydrolipoamide dehydrogenase
MSEEAFDLVVIGGGPAGYTAAIRAAELGRRVACVDARERPGGTCLYVGCIPSKALLDSSHRLHALERGLDDHGIAAEGVSFDLGAMMARKDEVVDSLTGGVAALFERHGIEHVHGHGRLGEPGRVVVTPADGGDGDARELRCEHRILATGSQAVAVPDAPVDGKRILTSTEALDLDEVPEHLVVVGAGYVGLEMASVWSRLGARVTCVEQDERVLDGMDADLAAAVQEQLEGQGVEFRLCSRVAEARAEGDGVTVRVSSDDDGDAETLDGSHCLVAVGREPRTEGVGLEDAGVELDARGFVRVEKEKGFRTTVSDVHAVGDVAGPPMLAHKAQDEALACVETLADAGPGHVNYEAIPAVVYTWPEAASVGALEEELRHEGVALRVGRSEVRHNGRARCAGETDGFVKLLAEEESGRLRGAHVVAPHAAALVHELVVTMQLGGSVEELARTCHGHPTWNETIREAALDAYGRGIHH